MAENIKSEGGPEDTPNDVMPTLCPDTYIGSALGIIESAHIEVQNMIRNEWVMKLSTVKWELHQLEEEVRAKEAEVKELVDEIHRQFPGYPVYPLQGEASEAGVSDSAPQSNEGLQDS